MITLDAFLTKPRTNVVLEKESQDYGAMQFTIDAHRILFRVAKITPKKIGQFVTLWKRSEKGPIAPFDETDRIDFIVIEMNHDQQNGYFIFPKKILCEKKIFSIHHQGGRRAMRVYAPWDKADNAQAKKTQAWQVQYFFDA